MWGLGDIDDKVLLWPFLTFVMTRDGECDVHCDPFGSPGTPLVGLNWESQPAQQAEERTGAREDDTRGEREET